MMTRTHMIIVAGFAVGWLLGWYMQGFYIYRGIVGNMTAAIEVPIEKKK